MQEIITNETRSAKIPCHVSENSIRFEYDACGYVTISISTGKRTSKVILKETDFSKAIKYIVKV
jgi:hypothetical protein